MYATACTACIQHYVVHKTAAAGCAAGFTAAGLETVRAVRLRYAVFQSAMWKHDHYQHKDHQHLQVHREREAGASAIQSLSKLQDAVSVGQWLASQKHWPIGLNQLLYTASAEENCSSEQPDTFIGLPLTGTDATSTTPRYLQQHQIMAVGLAGSVCDTSWVGLSILVQQTQGKCD